VIFGKKEERIITVSKNCVDTEQQKMDISMRQKRSLVLYNKLKNNWKREIQKYVPVRKEEA
jgi:hypothetical protein